MTNYNERRTMEDILKSLAYKVEWCVSPELLSGATVNRAREDEAVAEAKQALTSLIKELVAEAKPDDWGNVIAEPEHSENLKAYNAAYHDGVVDAVNNFEQNILKALEKL